MSRSIEKFREDKYQDDLEASLFNLKDKFHDDVFLILSHLIVNDNEGDFTRRSALYINERIGIHKFAETKANKDAADNATKLHKQVHDSFFSYIDRDNTFLDYVITQEKEKNKKISKSYWRYLFGEGEKLTKISEEKTLEDQSEIFLCEIPKKYMEMLCPYQVSKEFLKSLYNNPTASRFLADWNTYFEIRRMMVLSEYNQVINYDNSGDKDFITSYLDKAKSYIGELAGIQAAISYIGSIFKFNNDNENNSFTVDVIFTPLKENTSSQIIKYCVTMIVKSFDPNNVNIGKLISEEDIKLVYQPLTEYHTPSCVSINEFIYKKITFDSILAKQEEKTKKFLEFIDEIYPNSKFGNCPESYVIWCLMLLEQILEEAHENKKLDFFFVCGELSVFSDKTILRQTKNSPELGRLRVPKPSNLQSYTPQEKENFPTLLEIAAGLISKEHYPWFMDGRHALFWDITDTSGRPLGFIKLKQGNWKQVAEERVLQRINSYIPECIFFYSLGSDGTAGLVHLKPEKGNNDSTGTTITPKLLWHRDKWFFEKLQNNKLLKEYIKEILDKKTAYKEDRITRIANLVFKISLDKEKGGTIIVLDPSANIQQIKDGDTFIKLMGNALEVMPTGNDDDELRDRINLISHDGASILLIQPNEQTEWIHRGYVLPSLKNKEEIDILTAIFKHVHYQNDTIHPLSFKGTRRWSAAIAAFNVEVLLTIVISQDGDIQIWHVDHYELSSNQNIDIDSNQRSEKESKKGVYLYEIPIKSDHKKWQFNEEGIPEKIIIGTVN